MQQAAGERTRAFCVGIIGGNGWLGTAIARALVESGEVPAERIIRSGRSGLSADSVIPGARYTSDNEELARKSDVILLSVRPDQFAELKINARLKPVVSVMAGIRAESIARATGTRQVIRAMPNAAALIQQSFTPWYALPEVTAQARCRVRFLFSACGEEVEVPEEAHVDYFTGLTGTGAAYPALLAEALALHAVQHGLPEELARRAASSVVAGASQLFAGDRDEPDRIVREMIDYGGVTARALQAMLDHGFNKAVAAGLDTAFAMSRSGIVSATSEIPDTRAKAGPDGE